MKKIIIPIAIATLTACATEKPVQQKPKDFYKISDKDALAYVIETNNLTHCLPRGVRLATMNDAERRVLGGSKFDILTNIIGSKHANEIWSGRSKEAENYFDKKVEQLNKHQKNISQTECKILAGKFKQRLAKYYYENSPEGQYKRAMMEQANIQTLNGLLAPNPYQQHLQQMQIQHMKTQRQNQRESNQNKRTQQIINQIDQTGRSINRCVGFGQCSYW